MTNDERAVDLGKKIINLIASESEKNTVPAEVAIGALVVATTGTFNVLCVMDMDRAAEAFRRDVLRCAAMSAGHAN
jgi:hypothetical protein